MKNKKRNSGLLLAMPAIIGFLIFYLIPFLITVWYSVSFGVGAGEFVGMENYRMIFQNEMFLQAAGNTIRFLGVGIPVILVLSFFLALLLQMHLKGNRFFQLSFFVPFDAARCVHRNVCQNLIRGKRIDQSLDRQGRDGLALFALCILDSDRTVFVEEYRIPCADIFLWT